MNAHIEVSKVTKSQNILVLDDLVLLRHVRSV